MKVQTSKNDENNRGQQSKKDLKNEILFTWLGWRDSNPRMLGPEPSALPLGDIPLGLVEIVPLVPVKLKPLSYLDWSPFRPATICFASW